MDGFEAWAILHGRPLTRVGNEPDLSDEPALWAELWRQFRLELLPGEIKHRPGQRPKSWWQFDAPEERPEAESEVEFLHRYGLIEPDELEAIRKKAKTLAEYNRTRRPDRFGDNYLPPDDLALFAVAHELVTPEEIEILTRLETIGWYWKNPPKSPTNGQAHDSDSGL